MDQNGEFPFAQFGLFLFLPFVLTRSETRQPTVNSSPALPCYFLEIRSDTTQEMHVPKLATQIGGICFTLPSGRELIDNIFCMSHSIRANQISPVQKMTSHVLPPVASG